MATDVRTGNPIDDALGAGASVALRRTSDAAATMARTVPVEQAPRLPGVLRTGVIANRRSHRNMRNGVQHDHWPDVLYASPQTLDELAATLADYAARRIDLLVVDGGDGTLRDVLTAAAGVFDTLPPMAILPSGKTNALAYDLGIPDGWTTRDAIAAARAGRFAQREPVEVLRPGKSVPDARGFLLGLGGFVRATELAQSTHRAGAFNSVAVGLSLGWSILQTLAGGANNPWRRGETIRIAEDGGAAIDRQLYLLLASTLERMPLGLRPLGQPRPGLKMLTVNAPPRRLLRMVRLVLTGGDPSPALARDFVRTDPRLLDLHAAGGFILDGEHYAGGDLTVRPGAAIRFAVP